MQIKNLIVESTILKRDDALVDVVNACFSF